MSKAVFCDRCGILFPERNIHRVELVEIFPETKYRTAPYSGMLIPECETKTLRKDMCSLCIEKVIKFFNEEENKSNEI